MHFCSAEHWVAHSRISGEDIFRDCCRPADHTGPHRDELNVEWTDTHQPA